VHVLTELFTYTGSLSARMFAANNQGFRIVRIFRIFLLLALPACVWAGPYTGLTQRVANTTLAMPSQLPSATTNNYTTENAFPGLSLNQPIALATPPGETNRLFVVERPGVIMVITNLAVPTRTVFWISPPG
jgi:hypothetical protein